LKNGFPPGIKSVLGINTSEEPERRKDGATKQKEMIQAVIDEEPEPWIIMKPSRQEPTDPEPLCIFENPAEHTQAKAEIPLEWFQNRELEKIKEAVQQSLQNAQVQI
jgi:hypothetical protein